MMIRTKKMNALNAAAVLTVVGVASWLPPSALAAPGSYENDFLEVTVNRVSLSEDSSNLNVSLQITNKLADDIIVSFSGNRRVAIFDSRGGRWQLTYDPTGIEWTSNPCSFGTIFSPSVPQLVLLTFRRDDNLPPSDAESEYDFAANMTACVTAKRVEFSISFEALRLSSK